MQIILEKIKKGETDRVEFKTINNDKGELGNSFWETVCAFLNSKGGEILIGIDDNKNIVGIPTKNIDKIKTTIITLANNNNKLNPTFGLYPKEIEIDNKTIIQVQVPSSSLVHEVAIGNNKHVFIRQHESDTKLKTSEEIAKIVNDKKIFYSENIIYPGLRIDDFDDMLIQKYKDLIRSINPTHSYLSLSKLLFLKKSKLYITDFNQADRSEGFTLASVLLFGKDEVIKSILPHYKIDAVVKKTNETRYDDRLLIEHENLNLLSVYEALMDFIRKHLNDGFYLENDKRISLREEIFRELIVNFLIHQDYTNASISEIVITKNEVRFQNPTNPNPNLLNVFLNEKSSSFPKNPIIQHFFHQIKLFEGRGDGVSKVNEKLPLYIPGVKPIFIEERIFKMIIPLKSLFFNDLVNNLVDLINLRIKPEIIDEIKKLPINISFDNYESRQEKIFYLLYVWKYQINNEFDENDIGEIKFRENKIKTILDNTEKHFIETLLNTLKPASLTSLMKILVFNHRTNFKKNHINKLITRNLIKYTIPEKPNSRNQEYLISEAGKQFLGAYLNLL